MFITYWTVHNETQALQSCEHDRLVAEAMALTHVGGFVIEHRAHADSETLVALLERARRFPDPGYMAPVDRAFYELAIKERDAARASAHDQEASGE